MAGPYFSDLEQLRDWFINVSARPFWTTYRGSQRSASTSLGGNDSTDDLEEAWSLLERTLAPFLENGTGGSVLIVAKSSMSSGAASHTAVLKFPKYSANGFGPGISGLYPSMTSPYGQQHYISQQIDQQIALYKIERENEDLRAALDDANKGEGMERLVNNMLERFGPLIEGIASSFIAAKFGGAKSQVAISGMDAQGVTAPSVEEIQQQAQLDQYNAQLQRQIQALHTLGFDPLEVLTLVVTFVQKDGNAARTMLESLKATYS